MVDESGEVVEGARIPDLSEEEFLAMYEGMRLARRFDERAVSLQRQGRMGTYPSLSGQEAAQIGSAHALAEEDWMFPSYREHRASLVYGLSLKRTLLYWLGHKEGNYVPEDVNIVSVAVSIAIQSPHSTGAVWASRLKGEVKAFLCYFGDGETHDQRPDEHRDVNCAFALNDIALCAMSSISSAGKREVNHHRMRSGESSVSTTSPYAVYNDNVINRAQSPGFSA